MLHWKNPKFIDVYKVHFCKDSFLKNMLQQLVHNNNNISIKLNELQKMLTYNIAKPDWGSSDTSLCYSKLIFEELLIADYSRRCLLTVCAYLFQIRL